MIAVNRLYPLLQSAYRQHHSKETALLKVKNDLLINMNKEHVSLLVLLDLSAAFDTVDQTADNAWRSRNCSFVVQINLTGRSQRVSVNGTLSKNFELNWKVPQGSCLGPLLFIIYTSKLF